MKSFGLICIFLAAGATVAISATERTYAGTVGSRRAEFTLRWEDDGTVTGSYFCPDGKQLTYQLRGHNKVEGVLELDEFTRGTLSARLTLKKRTDGDQIIWGGTMNNVDGRKLDVAFWRGTENAPAKPAAPAAPGGAAGVSEYLAVMNYYDDPAGPKTTTGTAKLAWGPNGTVTGTLTEATNGRNFTIQGTNPRAGGVDAILTGAGGLRGRAELQKATLPRAICWSGIVYRGEKDSLFYLNLYRRTDGGPNPPATLRDCCVEVPRTLNARTTWEFPSMAGKALQREDFFDARRRGQEGEEVEIVGQGFDGKITAVDYAGGALTLRFSIGEYLDEYSGEVFVPTANDIALTVAYPDRPRFARPGAECFVIVDTSGAISRVSLGEAVISHWRKRADGLIEVKYLPWSKEFNSADPKPERFIEARLQPCIPDKVAMDSEKVRLGEDGFGLVWRAIYFDKVLGLVIHSDAAGPGELEIEAAMPTLKPPAEKPWISVFEKEGASSVPKSQAAFDAG